MMARKARKKMKARKARKRMKTGSKLRHKGTQVRRHVKHVEYKGTLGTYISTLANDLDQTATFSFNP